MGIRSEDFLEGGAECAYRKGRQRRGRSVVEPDGVGNRICGCGVVDDREVDRFGAGRCGKGRVQACGGDGLDRW